jgi:hypothetical protein
MVYDERRKERLWPQQADLSRINGAIRQVRFSGPSGSDLETVAGKDPERA